MDAVSLPPPSSPARSFPSFPAKFQRATWDAPPNNERERVCARTCACEREREIVIVFTRDRGRTAEFYERALNS